MFRYAFTSLPSAVADEPKAAADFLAAVFLAAVVAVTDGARS
ncbi:hypothetical protein AB0C96_32775 [Streptomyces sp. NPDC048506]